MDTPPQKTTAGFCSNKYRTHESVLTAHDFIDMGYGLLKLFFIFGFEQNQIPNFQIGFLCSPPLPFLQLRQILLQPKFAEFCY